MSKQQQYADLVVQLREWAGELGFQQVGVSGVDLGEHSAYLERWLAAGFHGEMAYMEKHGHRRARPQELVPGTVRVLSLRMDYWPEGTQPLHILGQPDKAYISRYALGRDYHKLVRPRLARLARRLQRAAGGNYRAFVDSAPVLERAIAENAGLGWIAKNTMLINNGAGSWFFLGEIYTDLPLPVDSPQTEKHCGSCTACLDICPTQAFTGPFQLDARRCISYLTIEHPGSIDESLRPLLGNRVFGCDDCQLVCPWNKFARPTAEGDFRPRHGLAGADLAELFLWSEEDWRSRTEGSPIRRIGYERWLRNLAVGLGNASGSPAVIGALKQRANHPSPLVREHVAWALARHRATSASAGAVRN